MTATVTDIKPQMHIARNRNILHARETWFTRFRGPCHTAKIFILKP